jgi:hypothetical protein
MAIACGPMRSTHTTLNLEDSLRRLTVSPCGEGLVVSSQVTVITDAGDRLTEM